MPYGPKRSPEERNDLKIKIAEYIGRGVKQSDIRKLMKEKHGLPEKTFSNYWTQMMKVSEAAIKKKTGEYITSFIERNESRIQEASVKFEKTDEAEWLKAAHTFDKDFFDRLQSMGYLPKAVEKQEIRHDGNISVQRVLEISRSVKNKKKKKTNTTSK